MVKMRGPIIWVVEDDLSCQRVIADSLTVHGFYPVVFGNAEKAYGALQSNTLPCLIILDMLLPGMSGVDLIRLLKQNRAWEKIPVVVISVLTRRDSPARESPAEANAAYWLNKPFEANVLIRKIQDILAAVGI